MINYWMNSDTTAIHSIALEEVSIPQTRMSSSVNFRKARRTDLVMESNIARLPVRILP
jgi:hypothetical protein